jgi:hypothetical protein
MSALRQRANAEIAADRGLAGAAIVGRILAPRVGTVWASLRVFSAGLIHSPAHVVCHVALEHCREGILRPRVGDLRARLCGPPAEN